MSSGDFSLRANGGSNFSNLVFRELCVCVSFTKSLTLLGHHVLHIGVEIAGHQMRRVHTLSVVTSVQDERIAKASISQLKRYAVRVSGLAVLMKLAVAVWHDAPCPLMAARIALHYLREKTSRQITLHVCPAFRTAWPYGLSS
jgi:hypothetical protein